MSKEENLQELNSLLRIGPLTGLSSQTIEAIKEAKIAYEEKDLASNNIITNSTVEDNSYEQCEFCQSHEKGDLLYELSSWDGGIGFNYIRNVKYCPICGKELKNESSNYQEIYQDIY